MKTKNYLSVFFLLITVAFSTSCKDDSEDYPNPDEYTNAITFFEKLDYSGAVFVSKQGNDILRTGKGEANREAGILNNTDTKFRIGSVSKTLTGMGIVQLKRDGLITSFDQFLSDFDESFPQGNTITVRHLLSHQSGVPDYVSIVEPAAKNGEAITPDDIYDAIKELVSDEGLQFTPGTSVAYSNSNFLIAALLIENLSGETYEHYIKTNVLDPLNMADTEMGTDEINGDSYAQGYNGNSNVSTYPMEVAFGAGCWTSTIGDMEKWCRAAMGASWFSEEEKNAVFGGNVAEGTTSFGLAWFNSTINGKTFYWHGGDIDGFASLIGFVPESQGIVIALSNEQDDTGEKRNLIIETIVANEM